MGWATTRGYCTIMDVPDDIIYSSLARGVLHMRAHILITLHKISYNALLHAGVSTSMRPWSIIQMGLAAFHMERRVI